MSWTADQIYTLPDPDLIKVLREIPYLRQKLFWVTDLAGVRNRRTLDMLDSDDGRRHNLPPNGVLVISPHLYRTGYDTGIEADSFWDSVVHEGEKWSGIGTSYASISNLPACLPVTESQIRLFGLLKTLNDETSVPFCYYKCEMWGGEIEEEYSVIFDKVMLLFMADSESDNTIEIRDGMKRVVDKTPLQLGLEQVGCSLPTWFFALHESSFDWRRYQLR